MGRVAGQPPPRRLSPLPRRGAALTTPAAGNPPPRRILPGRLFRGRSVLWTAGILVAGGIVLATAGLRSPGHSRAAPVVSVPALATRPSVRTAAPHHPGRQGRPKPAPARSPRRAVAIGQYAPAMAYSVPVGVTIPAIGVNASVLPLGENPDGTVRVPSLSTPMLTSWFDEGPSPGQDGPAAIYGHVDTAATGPAVFFRLGDLVAGDKVDVTLADHRIAIFEVYRVAEYPKSAFPTMAVYGDTPGPELRLMTCGGPFDAAAGSYDDNIVVYARLVAAAAG